MVTEKMTPSSRCTRMPLASPTARPSRPWTSGWWEEGTEGYRVIVFEMWGWRNLQTYRQGGGEDKHLRRGTLLVRTGLTQRGPLLKVCSCSIRRSSLQYLLPKEYARAS